MDVFKYDQVCDYADPHTGEDPELLAGHYRVYDRETDAYLGYVVRNQNNKADWRAIIPNPKYDPAQGPGCRNGAWVGRRVNPPTITLFATTRGDLAKMLADHHERYPNHRPVEARPRCEALVSGSA